MTDPLWDVAVRGTELEEQRRLLDERLTAAGIEPALVEGLRGFTAPGALFKPDDRGSSWAGAGDELLVPAGWSWPESAQGPLALLAEIDLGDVVGVDQLGLFSSSGRLLFFHDETPGLIQPWLDACHVEFVESGAECSPVPTRGEFQPPGRAPLLGAVMPLIGLDDNAYAMFREFGAPNAGDQVCDATEYQGVGWRLLGRAQLDTPLSEEIRFWFINEESNDDRECFSEAERQGRGWRPLLQLSGLRDPRYGLDVGWGVGDRLTFCLPEVDLAAGRFDRVIAVIAS